MGCSLPGSSVYGIFQAIVLEWIAISFSRGSLQPGDRTGVSHIVDRRFTVWATRGSHFIGKETETLYKLRVYPAIIPLEEVRPQTSLWERPLLPPLYYPLPLASTTIFFFFACLIFQKILSFRRLSVIHFFELLKTWNIMLKILLIHMDWVYWLSKI